MLEKSGLPNKSQDLVAVQFVIHECPEEITRQMVSCTLALRTASLAVQAAPAACRAASQAAEHRQGRHPTLALLPP